ncbi:MAG: hypothetical protein AAFZ92_08970 [Pseudomonadota bacterium]
MRTSVDRYAVFGNPIAHSKSPLMQMAFAHQTQQAMQYSSQCVAINDFKTENNAIITE